MKNKCYLKGVFIIALSIPGTPLVESGGVDISSVVVDTVAKQSKHKTDQLPKFRSDPAKITCKGPGLKKAITHKLNSFQVNCQDAGKTLWHSNICNTDEFVIQIICLCVYSAHCLSF